MSPVKKYRKSLSWHVALLYFFMNLASIAFFSYVIGSHQAELAVELTRYQAMDLMSGLLGDFEAGDSAHAVAQVRNVVAGSRHRYAFVRDYQTVVVASEGFGALASDFKSSVQKAEMARDFSGKRFYLRVKPKEQEIHFFVPMDTFGQKSTVLFLKMDMRDIGSRMKSMATLVLLAVIVLSFVHLVFALLVLQWVVKPIRVLWDATEKVAQGDDAHRVRFNRIDEIGGLAEGFNRMLDVIRGDKLALEHRMELLQDANARIEKMAITDALTGIYNRRYFMEQLNKLMALATETGSALSLILIDVDFFKKINDTRGHVVGDLVLSKLGKSLHGCMRGNDVVARYGGEEFVVLLPGTDAQPALQVAERYRQTIASMDFTEEGYTDLKVTISLGVASFRAVHKKMATTPAPEDFLRAVDEALYFSKENGRNRSTLYGAEQK